MHPGGNKTAHHLNIAIHQVPLNPLDRDPLGTHRAPVNPLDRSDIHPPDNRVDYQMHPGGNKTAHHLKTVMHQAPVIPLGLDPLSTHRAPVNPLDQSVIHPPDNRAAMDRSDHQGHLGLTYDLVCMLRRHCYK